MGSYCELQFGELSICSSKSWVPDELAALFQEADRTEGFHLDEDAEEDEDPELTVMYVASRDTILQRLSLLGATEEATHEAFAQWLSETGTDWTEYAADGWGQSTADALATFSFEEWKARAPVVLATRYDFSREHEPVDEIDRHMRDSDSYSSWLWFAGYGSHLSLRALLDACASVQRVSLDITDLVRGGYYKEDDRVCEEARRRAPQDPLPLLPTMILAEGSTDILVLRRSLQAMHPDR